VLWKLIIVAALAAVLVSSASGGSKQGTVATTELMPGVTYSREVDFTPAGPVVLDVVTAPKPDGTVYSLAPALSNQTLVGTEPLTKIESRLDAAATTVGIDGDYFHPDTGLPSGIVMRGGVLDAEPAIGRSSLGIAADGTLQVAQVALTGRWQGSGQPHPLDLNPARGQGQFGLYTTAFGTRTPTEQRIAEAVLTPFPPTVPGQPLDGVVTRIWHHGGIPIPAGGAVLVGRRAEAAQVVAEAKLGGQVEVRLTLSPDWSALSGAIGGGPLLVLNGRAVFDAGEAFAPGNLNARAPRGAVGQLADGRIVFVTAEGGDPAYSVGMSSYSLAVELVRLGAVTAFGLGSGSPASLAFDGTLLTHPPSGRELRISDALVLSYTGVYAALPSETVLSPNGDGVADTQTLAYRLVRPANVVATLAGPGGTTIPLASDAEQPGLHTISWDGTAAGAPAPEGAWTFSVTATDDRGVTTTAERGFSLDDTLSSLSLARGSGGQVLASFRLSRPARVVVRIERPNGVAVATFRARPLQAGVQQVGWSGRIDGKPAPRGRYQVDVEAASSVGTSSLVAPFVWR
jgi:hypothetical protein